MDDNRNDEIVFEVRCKLALDNQRNGASDLMNDVKPEGFDKQLQFYKEQSSDKIFNELVEDLNLTTLYLNGFDVTIIKYGKRNVFYEDDLKTDKTDESTSSEDSDDSESDDEFHGGLVQKFIRTIFEELVSVKDLKYIFSIGWTEISERNQLLDLLNGNGLIQCFSMSQLLDALTVGLSNRNSTTNHNILSIVLEQQWINPTTAQPQMKLSTVNFCDLDYDTDRAALNNFISEPRELPMNFYTQQTSQLPPYAYMMPSPNGNYFSPPPVPPEFGFFNGNNIRNSFDPSTLLVQQQSNKLLKNAEILFSRLNLNDMNDEQRKEIQEWMYLKTECDSISTAPELPPSYFGNINSFTNSPPQQLQNQQTSLLPIIEMDETNDPDEEDETNDNDSDCGSYIDINDHSNNLFAKISDKMMNFREKTDEVVQLKSSEYFQNNPQVSSSGQSDAKSSNDLLDEASGGVDLKMTNTSMSEQEYLSKSGRRRSVRDANVLNSEEMDLIRKAAVATSLDHETVKENMVDEHMTKLDELRKALKKSLASIDATNFQTKEVEKTIALKKKLITEKVENDKTRLNAKSNCNKKKKKYQAEVEKTDKELSRAVINGKSAKEIQRLRELGDKLREKLKDLNGINEITAESSTHKELKTLQKSLKHSKNQLDKFNQALKKEIKHKESIEKDISKQMKMIEGNKDHMKLVAASPSPSSAAGSKISDNKVKIRDVNARISHLDEILKEKSSNLKIFGVSGSPEDKKDVKLKDSLRYEIRNLRRTRDTLMDQLVELRDKFKRGKMLTDKENRQLMVCDESIHAIDDVIEAKNELICGHKSIDTDERHARERGEQLLMARLNKLSHDEMRILLYKYFMKVIDMKDSCKKLEIEMQRMREAYEWHVKTSNRNIQMERLENETHLVMQKMYYEHKINLLLRNLGNETASSSVNESFDNGAPSGVVALPAYEDLNVVQGKRTSHRYHSELRHQTENDKDMKSLFARIQLHRIQGASTSPRTSAQKENLKLKEKKPATTLKREGKKLVIQTD